jgi:membrane-associated phospholipid phosphatase
MEYFRSFPSGHSSLAFVGLMGLGLMFYQVPWILDGCTFLFHIVFRVFWRSSSPTNKYSDFRNYVLFIHIFLLVIHACTVCNEKNIYMKVPPLVKSILRALILTTTTLGASFIASSRIMDGSHFTEDVAAGSILGACGAALIVACPLILPTTPLGGNKQVEKNSMIYIWGIEMQAKEMA